jgi:hypothetical protein
MSTDNGNKTNLNPELIKLKLKEPNDNSTRINPSINDLSYSAHAFE